LADIAKNDTGTVSVGALPIRFSPVISAPGLLLTFGTNVHGLSAGCSPDALEERLLAIQILYDFLFPDQKTRYASIWTTGFDKQLAVYKPPTGCSPGALEERLLAIPILHDFLFLDQKTRYASIWTTGFDKQLAVYKPPTGCSPGALKERLLAIQTL